MLCVWRAELTEVNTRWNSGGETKMSSQGLGHRSTETAEKSRMAGKRLAKVEKKALPRVELGFFRLRRRLRRAALSVDGVHRWHQPSRIDRRAGI